LLAFKERVPGLEPRLSESRLDDVYVALKNLLRAKFMTAATKEQAARVVEELNKEAFAQTVMRARDHETKDAA
jgi:hypothetical protein